MELYNQFFSIQNLPVLIQSGSDAIFLETKPSYTIGDIKSMIREKKGIHTDELKLRFGGRLLEDGCTLRNYGIQYGATIGTCVYDECLPLPSSSLYRDGRDPSIVYVL